MEEQKTNQAQDSVSEDNNIENKSKPIESEFAQGESSYILDDNSSIENEESEENEVDATEIDFSKWNEYDLDKIKEEAESFINNAEDITRVGAIMKKLRELHNTKIDLEKQNLVEADEENLQEQIQDLEAKDAEFSKVWDSYQKKRKEHFDNIQKTQEENYSKKIALLDDLKKIIEDGEPLKNTFDEFRNIQEKWREIGMVPKDKNNDLWLNYNHHVQMFLDKVKLNRELRDLDMKKNMELKVELCEKAEALIIEKSMHEAFKKLQDLHRQWKEIGPVPSDIKDEIWDRFRNASEKIREVRIKHYEELNKKLDANLEAKLAIKEKAQAIASGELNNIKSWNKATKKINELFELWRSIGPVPKENNNQVWTEFKGILDTFFASRKEYFDIIKTELNENYNKKLNICLEAEAIKYSNEWKKTSNELIRLQNEWKKIGAVPKAKSDAIWLRFRAACDDFFNRKKEYFDNISTIEAENLNKKTELIKEIEEYKFSDDNKENLNVIHDFQRRWFEIGRVPIAKKEKIQNEWQKKIDTILEKLKISRFEAENKRYKEHIDAISKMNDGNDKMWTELKKLRFNLSKLEQDINLWENNLSFFSNSKNAELLLKEFHDKINKAKVDLKVMKEKEKYLMDLIGQKK